MRHVTDVEPASIGLVDVTVKALHESTADTVIRHDLEMKIHDAFAIVCIKLSISPAWEREGSVEETVGWVPCYIGYHIDSNWKVK